MDETYLFLSEGGSARSHHILHSVLIHRNHIEIAFHKIATIVLDDGLLGGVEAVEFALLGVDFRLGRVDILPRVGRFGIAQKAPAESDHTP